MWKGLIIDDILLILIIATVFYLINIVFSVKIKKIKIRDLCFKDYIDILWKSLLLGYICAVINITFISRSFFVEPSIELLPFRGIEDAMEYWVYGGTFGIQIDFLIGNVLMFVPLGFLVPLVFKKIDKYYKIFIVSLISTLSIEIFQVILQAGGFDIDDVIYNVTGAMLGYGLCLIYQSIFAEKGKKIKTVFRGLVPYMVCLAIFIIVKVIYVCSPYGVLPETHIYDDKKCNPILGETLEIDDETFEDYVYKEGSFVYDNQTKLSIVNNIFKYLNLGYRKENSNEKKANSEDDDFGEGDNYISLDGNYRVNICDSGFSIYNIKEYDIFKSEEEARENADNNDEDEKKVFLDRNQISECKEYAIELLNNTGINMTDKSYYEINTSYPSLFLTFSGYEEDNQKVVKNSIINVTSDGNIAAITLNNRAYTKTNDKLRVISTKEAIELLKSGKAGTSINNNHEIISITLDWWNCSTKGFYVPTYSILVMKKDKLLSGIYQVTIPAWEFE